MQEEKLKIENERLIKKDEELVLMTKELREKEKQLKVRDEEQNRKDIDLKAREEEQKDSAGAVAKRAFQRGYNVAARVHVYLFGNAIGT